MYASALLPMRRPCYWPEMSNSSPHIAVLIVAAGSGLRFGAEVPKQYAVLRGKPLLRLAIEGCLGADEVGVVRCVIHPDFRPHYEMAVDGLSADRLGDPVYGGPTRQESVKAGLEALAGGSCAPDIVLIHDAARPLVDGGVIRSLLESLDRYDGVIPVLPLVDTVKRSRDGATIETTLDRSLLWRAQTPQAFNFNAILAAHRNAGHNDFTDDADVLQAAGKSVGLVPGSERLAKVTTGRDLEQLESMLALPMEVRTGFGFDVHAFGDGDHVVLGGVRISHSRGLSGHSDADVGIHALCDALFGALADGDIGSHFPPSEEQWKGADSSIFLAYAADLVRKREGSIQHLDLTLVCEAPKIGPHRERMRVRIAEIARIDIGRVAVKATTSERLGFTGRGEGIAAHAVATLSLPVPPS